MPLDNRTGLWYHVLSWARSGKSRWNEAQRQISDTNPFVVRGPLPGRQAQADLPGLPTTKGFLRYGCNHNGV